jgi:hypothetical protein
MVMTIVAICTLVLLAYSQYGNRAVKPVPIKVERDGNKRR